MELKNILQTEDQDATQTFVVVEKFFSEYRNVERRDVVIITSPLITTASLKSQILTTVSQSPSSNTCLKCHFPHYTNLGHLDSKGLFLLRLRVAVRGERQSATASALKHSASDYHLPRNAMRSGNGNRP